MFPEEAEKWINTSASSSLNKSVSSPNRFSQHYKAGLGPNLLLSILRTFQVWPRSAPEKERIGLLGLNSKLQFSVFPYYSSWCRCSASCQKKCCNGVFCVSRPLIVWNIVPLLLKSAMMMSDGDYRTCFYSSLGFSKDHLICVCVCVWPFPDFAALCCVQYQPFGLQHKHRKANPKTDWMYWWMRQRRFDKPQQTCRTVLENCKRAKLSNKEIKE